MRLEVVWMPPGLGSIDAGTRFSIVAVRERPRVQYRCRHCEAYAPFICSACPPDAKDNRVCDRHVAILDGALTPTCQDHRPPCQTCANPAEFRCAGRACRREKAWCGAHRRRHPRDPDVAYCPSCYGDVFPRCEQPGCKDIGTVRCECVSRSFSQCSLRMCTRHATRWQVFGGERMGLGLCAIHSRVRGLPPDELIFRIIAGASGRRWRERLPSLQGFAHTLRNCGHLNLAIDYPGIQRLLEAEGHAVRGNKASANAFDRARAEWKRQAEAVAQTSLEGERLVKRLRELVVENNPRFGPEIAEVIELAEFKAASIRDGKVRAAMLFVKVPEHLRGHFIGTRGQSIQRYTEELGVKVQIEGRRR
ncbi:KH domain-containing protein [Nocardia sp. NPDC059246]|uniref:KH domain-containing protein n=1 Tax=unclassified Nocardia TaxID=2637762 RepID=UPI0036C17F58